MSTKILRANLYACLLFCLPFLVLPVLELFGVFGGSRRWPTAEDAAVLLALMSPIVIWSTGAWILKGHSWMSIAWLAASIVLMLVGLLGLYLDIEATVRERRTGEETMHLGAFFAMILQWFVAVVLLAVLLFARILTR